MDVEAIRKLLAEKAAKYRADGNADMARNADEILRAGPMAVKATTPHTVAEPRGSGRKLRLREATAQSKGWSPHGRRGNGLTVSEMIHIAKTDPARWSAMQADARRPEGVSKAAYGVAVRAASGDSMLVADTNQVREGLDYNHHANRVKIGGLYKSIIVKPSNRTAARLGREGNESFWGERKWNICTLKYASGYVIITDNGDYSRTFPTFGELVSAIRKSGFEVRS